MVAFIRSVGNTFAMSKRECLRTPALWGRTFPVRNEHDLNTTIVAIRVGLARINEPQVALAKLLNLSQTALHRRMTGQVSWRLDELTQVAEFLGVPMAELVGPEKASA